MYVLEIGYFDENFIVSVNDAGEWDISLAPDDLFYDLPALLKRVSDLPIVAYAANGGHRAALAVEQNWEDVLGDPAKIIEATIPPPAPFPAVN